MFWSQQMIMFNRYNSIHLINNISKFLYVFALVLCSIVFAINIYILLGGSLEGQINIQAIINQNDNTSNYSNFNQVPFLNRLLMFLLVTISAGLILSILKFWGNFISLIKDEKYFEIDTIKNLQYISYLLLGIWTLLFIIEFFSDIIFTTSFSTDIIANENNVNENTIDSSFSLPPSIFLINGIIFWVLSHIIMEGIKLKKENELTI